MTLHHVLYARLLSIAQFEIHPHVKSKHWQLEQEARKRQQCITFLLVNTEEEADDVEIDSIFGAHFVARKLLRNSLYHVAP